MKQSCALDVADSGPLSLDDIGELEGLTRERVRQIEYTALRKLQGATDHLPEFPISPYRPPAMTPCSAEPQTKPETEPETEAVADPMDDDEERRSEILALFSGRL